MYVLKDTHIKDIPPSLSQVFYTSFTKSIGQKEIVKMRNEKTISDRDLEIAKLLFRFSFATLEQIQRYIRKVEGSEIALSTLRNRLDKLISYRLLNKFMLSGDTGFDKIQSDAMEFYCLDLGGRYLLSHYTNIDTSDWYTSTNMKSSDNVAKSLTVLNFYLNIFCNSQGSIQYFNVFPELRVAKKAVTPSFEMAYKVGESLHYFMGEVVRDIDFPIEFREKALKLERLLTTEAWMKYCPGTKNAPVLFVITDSDKLAAMVAPYLEDVTEIRRYRMTTDERIYLPFSQNGSIMKFDAERGAMVGLSARILE